MTLYQIPGIMEIIRNELLTDVRAKTLVTKMENSLATCCTPEYLTDTQKHSEELVDRVWLYSSLIDAALSKNVKYEPKKYGCEKEWFITVRWLKVELHKRKFIFGYMIHNVSKLCEMASGALLCLKPDLCGQSLSGWVRKNGESLTDFYETVAILRKRLLDLIDFYQRYQRSWEDD